MSAYNEALDAMERELDLGAVLDAIPDKTLVHLLIDRGVLEQVAWRRKASAYDGSRHNFIGYHAGECGHADHERVYRIREEQ